MKRIALLLPLCLLATSAFASIPTSTIWEIRSTASGTANANGGGFNYGNSFALNDLSCTSATGDTPDCSSLTYTFVANDQDAWLLTVSGTTFYANQFCKISSISGGHAIIAAAIGQCVILSNNRWIANTVAGVASGASPSSGVFGVDFSQQDAAEFAAITDGGAVGTTFTSASSTFRTIFRGNFIHITSSGTGAHCVVGWYHIDSVTDATNVVLDRDPTTGGNGVSCTFSLGGALSLTSSDDAVFELATASSSAANRYFIKGGSSVTYALGGAVTTSASGNAAQPITVEGYASLRGDRPTAATRPTLSTAGNVITTGVNWNWRNIQFTGTGTSVFTGGSGTQVTRAKAVNSSTTAGRVAFSSAGDTSFSQCEAVSYRGIAFSITNVAGGSVISSYAHDSDIGIQTASTAGAYVIADNIIESNVTAAIKVSSAPTGAAWILGNTLLGGSTTPVGTGISIVTGTTDLRVLNNIIYGFVTGVAHADAQTIAYANWNAYYNNTANFTSGDTSKWQIAASDQTTLDPTFANVAQYTNSGTVTTTTNVLSQNTSTFANVVDNRDFLVMTSGSTCTSPLQNTKVLITGHTTSSTSTLTVSSNLSTSGTCDTVTYYVQNGHDYSIGTNLKALGNPGAFPAALTTGYRDIGAVQRQESGSSGGQKGFTWVQ